MLAVLSLFRQPDGSVDHSKTLSIPFDQRIPALVAKPNGRNIVSVAISSMLVSSFQHIKNAKLDADQIIEMAEMIIDSSHEDKLSVEDIMLFLKDMLMGRYGKFSNGMDMPAFFEAFEEYRNERYKTAKRIEWEEHLTFKSLGDSNRAFDELPLKREDDPQSMMGMMQTYYESKGDE